MFICAKCKKAFSSSQVQVDHIDPVVPIGQSGKDMSLDLILDRLWCDDKNLQVLCTPCHKKKSREEAQLRKKARSK